MNVIIVGGGIGGFTLALCLDRAGIACQVYELAPEIRPLGVGINILPHASRALAELGLESALSSVSVLTREAVFFNRELRRRRDSARSSFQLHWRSTSMPKRSSKLSPPISGCSSCWRKASPMPFRHIT